MSDQLTQEPPQPLSEEIAEKLADYFDEDDVSTIIGVLEPYIIDPNADWRLEAPCLREAAHREHEWDQEGVGKVRCPGIRAHRNTAIGGANDGKPAAYGQVNVSELMGGQK